MIEQLSKSGASVSAMTKPIMSVLRRADVFSENGKAGFAEIISVGRTFPRLLGGPKGYRARQLLRRLFTARDSLARARIHAKIGDELHNIVVGEASAAFLKRPGMCGRWGGWRVHD